MQQKALFVKNLPPNTTEKEVLALHGGILKAKLEVAKNSSKTKYALLDFVDDESAKDALKQIHGKELNGHKLYIDYLESSSMISYNQSNILSQTQDPLKLYVTGFGQNLDEAQLAKFFPTASSLKLDLHPRTKRSVGFAFIHFDDAAEARRVHDLMQDATFEGRSLVVMYAKRGSFSSSEGTDDAPAAKKARLGLEDEDDGCTDDDGDDDDEGEDGDNEEEDDDEDEGNDDEDEDDGEEEEKDNAYKALQ